MAASLGGKATKLTTLEKSKLDWNKCVQLSSSLTLTLDRVLNLGAECMLTALPSSCLAQVRGEGGSVGRSHESKERRVFGQEGLPGPGGGSKGGRV